ncbi:MAG TPA: methyltransferase domain-containing protein [Candidatus Limnocylindrales bacterium]|nr:methyltransferase domain-containing protein [Candidatus Limnocylindrales bacterium]
MTDLKEAVRQQFEAAAERYRTSVVHAQGEDLARLVMAAGLTSHERVLDAGCGAGHASMAVAPFAAEVTALDLSEAMLHQVEALADERGLGNVKALRGDIEAVPAGDGAYDCAVSRYSAHHWPNPAAAIRELHRVLKPGGVFVLSDIVSPEAPALDTFLQAIELLRDPSHVRDHTVVQWLALLNDAGFEAEAVFEWRLPLDFEPWIERIGTPEQNATIIRALFAGAPAEVHAEFEWEERGAFVISGALFRGVRKS